MPRFILKACPLWAVLLALPVHFSYSADPAVESPAPIAESFLATPSVESEATPAEPLSPTDASSEAAESIAEPTDESKSEPTKSSAAPAVSAVELYPAETKGFISIPDPDDLVDKVYETQLGQLASDPAMQPFVEDLKRQIQEKINSSHIRLGVGWDELTAVCSGELSFAMIDPPQSKQNYAFAAIVDVSGQEEEVAQLLERVQRNMAKRGATKELTEAKEIPVTVYTVPLEEGKRTFKAVLCTAHGHLVACDHLEMAMDIVASLAGAAPSPRLAELTAYRKVMERCERDTDPGSPQFRWFIDPLGYARVARAAAGGRRRRGVDILKVISEQGFDAVQAVGGLVNLATGTHEILHRTFAYAPGVERNAGDKNSIDKYDLAARILEFRNGEQLDPPAWIPSNAATFVTVNWDAKRAFGYISTLVDAIADSPGFFEDLLGSLETDQHGPQLNVRKELVAHLGDRVTFFTDCLVPVTPDSERVLLAVSLTDPAAMTAGVQKMFRTDPNAQKLVVDGHTLWELVKEDEEETPGLVVDGGDFGTIPSGLEEEDDSDDGGFLFPSIGVIGVVEDQLMISSHVDLVAEIIQRRKGAATLKGSADLDLVNRSLAALGVEASAIRIFSRTDEEYRATYELIRQGRMPESESILGRLINRLLGPEEKGVLREQQIDGKNMPEYQVVRRYLGPAGIAVGTEDEGWYAVGVLLNKSVPSTPDPLPEPLETAASDDGLLSE